VPVAVPVRRRRTRHSPLVESPHDPSSTAPLQPAREDPLHVRGCRHILLQAPSTPPPLRVRPIRMRPGIHQPVSVRWPSSQIAPQLRLNLHRLQTRPDHLPLRLRSQLPHVPPLIRIVQIHRPVDLRQPDLNTVPLQQRRQVIELSPAESALVLPHHDRVEPAIRVLDRRQQPRRLRPVAPATPSRRRTTPRSSPALRPTASTSPTATTATTTDPGTPRWASAHRTQTSTPGLDPSSRRPSRQGQAARSSPASGCHAFRSADDRRARPDRNQSTT